MEFFVGNLLGLLLTFLFVAIAIYLIIRVAARAFRGPSGPSNAELLARMSTLGALSQAWISAEAALPLGWKIMGLQRDADAELERWTATAQGPGPADVATRTGDEPSQALLRLADALRERPSPGDMKD